MAGTVGDMSQDQLVNAIVEGFSRVQSVNRQPGAGPNNAASSSSGNLDIMGTLTRTGQGVVDSFTGLTMGVYGTRSALNDFSGVVGKFGPVGEVVGKFGGQIGKAVLDVNDVMRDTSRSGVYFGNNLGLMTDKVLEARMSLPEFADMVRQNSQALSGLGMGMDRSSLAFLKLARDVQMDPLVGQLQATGVGIDEFGKILALNTVNRKNLDMTTASANKAVVDSTIAVATEMDNISRLYGISRQQQQKDLADNMAKAEVQLSIRAMGAKEQDAYIKNIVGLEKFGGTIKDLYTAEATGGLRTSKDTANVAAVGPVMGALVKELAAIKDVSTVEGKERRAEIVRQMEAERLRQQDAKYLKESAVLATGGGEYGAARAKYLTESMPGGDFEFQAKLKAEQKGITIEQAKKEITSEIEASRRAAGTGKGPEGAAALPSQVINQTERVFKDISAASGGVFKALNTAAGETAGEFVKVNGALRPFSSGEAKNALDNIRAAIEQKVGATGSTNITPSNLPAGTLVTPKPVERADGSFGATGKYMEDFGAGTPAILHGREGVITEKQFNDLFKNVTTQIGKVQDRPLPTISAPTKTEKADANVQKAADRQLLSDVTTQISKVTKPEVNPNQQLVNDITTKLTKTQTEVTPKQFSGMFEEARATIEKGQFNFDKVQSLFGDITSKMASNKAEPQILQSQQQRMLSDMQGGLKSELEKSRALVPSTETFEKIFNQIKIPDAAEISSAVTSKSQPSIMQTQETDAMTDIANGVTELNKRIERLITAVTDGSDKSVRALKSKGNLLA